MDDPIVDRAQGCLLGQLAGDSLGSLVEFQTPGEIRRRYPDGPRELADGGTWDTLAGQPTDDSEMALDLARLLVRDGAYNAKRARAAYRAWLDSEPFDCGNTTAAGLLGNPNPDSQANGALMRISPLGIFGARHNPRDVGTWARQDAALTHPHPNCLQVNELFACAIAAAIRTGMGGDQLFEWIANRAETVEISAPICKVIERARLGPPDDYCRNQGWVLIAFQNALWQIRQAQPLEVSVVETVARGGDTDTNAAICGALLGAIQGKSAIPDQWQGSILSCEASGRNPRCSRPRPKRYWPTDALQIAYELVSI